MEDADAAEDDHDELRRMLASRPAADRFREYAAGVEGAGADASTASSSSSTSGGSGGGGTGRRLAAGVNLSPLFYSVEYCDVCVFDARSRLHTSFTCDGQCATLPLCPLTIVALTLMITSTQTAVDHSKQLKPSSAVIYMRIAYAAVLCV